MHKVGSLCCEGCTIGDVVYTEVPSHTRLTDDVKPPRICSCLWLILLSLPALPLPGIASDATGRFEVYCDGVGLFLAKIDGAPAPRKLVLFSRMRFPPGTVGGRYLRQGKWSNAAVFRNGCVPDGKCKSIADAKVLIDAWDTPDYSREPPPKRISGKYEIDLKGKHLEGSFLVKQYHRTHALRLCM